MGNKRTESHKRNLESARNVQSWSWRRRTIRERTLMAHRVALLSHTPTPPPAAAVDDAGAAAWPLDTHAVLCCTKRRPKEATHRNAIASEHNWLNRRRPAAAHSLVPQTTAPAAARAVLGSLVHDLARQAPQGVQSATQQKDRKAQQGDQQLQAQQEPYDWWHIEMDLSRCRCHCRCPD